MTKRSRVCQISPQVTYSFLRTSHTTLRRSLLSICFEHVNGASVALQRISRLHCQHSQHSNTSQSHYRKDIPLQYSLRIFGHYNTSQRMSISRRKHVPSVLPGFLMQTRAAALMSNAWRRPFFTMTLASAAGKEQQLPAKWHD